MPKSTSSVRIPYELFFIGATDEEQRVLEVLKAEQEENRELDDLVRAAKCAPLSRMIKFSRDLVDSYFADRYRRGSVIRYNMKCDDPSRSQRFKFGIVYSTRIAQNPEALLAIATTKIEWFASGRFEGDIVRLQVGAYSWVTAETVVDLRTLRPELLEVLKILNERQDMAFEQEPNPTTMAEVDNKLRASRLISCAQKSALSSPLRTTWRFLGLPVSRRDQTRRQRNRCPPRLNQPVHGHIPFTHATRSS